MHLSNYVVGDLILDGPLCPHLMLLHLVDLAGWVELPRAEILDDLVLLNLLYLLDVLLVAVQLLEHVRIRILDILQPLYYLLKRVLLQIVHQQIAVNFFHVMIHLFILSEASSHQPCQLLFICHSLITDSDTAGHLVLINIDICPLFCERYLQLINRLAIHSPLMNVGGVFDIFGKIIFR